MIAHWLCDPRRPGPFLRRLNGSTIVWSWGLNFLRLAAGFILLPLVVIKLPNAEFGMYFVLLSQVALVPLVDFGFGPTIGRFVGYAMGGAESLQSHGVAQPGRSTQPNYELLWQLLFTTQRLYRYLCLLALVVLCSWGTYNVELRIHETASSSLTRLAWAVTVVASLLDIYSNWWGVYLRSMNEVLAATRIAVMGMVVRLVIASALLLCGGGLVSIPLGSLVGSVLARHLARRCCLERLAGHPPPKSVDIQAHLRVLWPNTWRLGVQFLSGYLTVNANTTICQHVLGLSANAQYGLSVQLLDVAAGIAAVWTSVKWPLISQYRARHDFDSLQKLLWPRVWLQTLTFLVMAAGVLIGGPWLLDLLGHLFGKHKELLPLGWMALLTINAFFFMQFNLWGTLISTENRLTYLWPTVATNVLSLILSLALIRFTALGVGSLVLGPLLAGCLFNYWYWPLFAARGLGTTLFRFLTLGPGMHSARDLERRSPTA